MRIYQLNQAVHPPCMNCVDADATTRISVGERPWCLELCRDCMAELRQKLPRLNQRRPLNRRQCIVLDTIAATQGARRSTIVRAVGRYGTQTLKSCIQQQLVVCISLPGVVDDIWALTEKGRAAREQLEAAS